MISCQFINKFRFSSFPKLSCVHEQQAGSILSTCSVTLRDKTVLLLLGSAHQTLKSGALFTTHAQLQILSHQKEDSTRGTWRPPARSFVEPHSAAQASVRDTFAGRTSFYEPEELKLRRRDSSRVRSSGCSHRAWVQFPAATERLPGGCYLGDPRLPSGFYRYCIHIMYRLTCRENSCTHKIKGEK